MRLDDFDPSAIRVEDQRGGRFVIVPAATKAVFYVCSGADGTLDSSGNGKGTLVRLKNYGFNASGAGIGHWARSLPRSCAYYAELMQSF